jgi:hypothetical protein
VLERLDAARDGAGLACAVKTPAPALALEALLQCDVDLEQVDRLEGRRLVDDRSRWIYDVSVNRDSRRLPQAPRAPTPPLQTSSGGTARLVGRTVSLRLAGALGLLPCPLAILAGALGLLPCPFPILAEPHLEEHQADRDDHSDAQHPECEV